MNFALSRHAPYYRAIRSAFAVLHSATEHVREKSVMRQVTISLIPLFGINLFIPRLVEFLAQNPELDINVTYANHRSYSSEPATGRAIGHPLDPQPDSVQGWPGSGASERRHGLAKTAGLAASAGHLSIFVSTGERCCHCSPRPKR